LPLPVTPSSRIGAKPPRAASSASIAARCASFGGGPACGAGASCEAGTAIRSTSPRLASARAAPRQPWTASSSRLS
jgi:hypothetical protein